MNTPADPLAAFTTPAELLEHWQGHQRLTRRTIEVFPEDQLFSFTPAPPMRPYWHDGARSSADDRADRQRSVEW